jgi:hypothetical protein
VDQQATESPASGDERERALDVRESRLDAREDEGSDRRDAIREVLANAAQRDDAATVRDLSAARRDIAANNEDETGCEHGHARGAARGDRLYSRVDRDSSAIDRSVLAVLADDDDPEEPGT